MKKYIIFILFISINLMAQQKTNPQNTEPLELPNFIIQGNLQLDISTGTKQDPSKPLPLDSKLLDLVNSLDKQPPILINSSEIIPLTYKNKSYDAYLGIDFGRYSTGNIYGGYNFKLFDYSLNFTGNYNFTQGHQDYANCNKLDLKLTSDYIAPMKFYIFGGSRTRTNIEYKNYDYNLYSQNISPINRKVNHFKADLDVEGKFKGFDFNTGLGFNGLQFTSNEINTADNNVFGYFKGRTMFDDFLIGGNILLDFHRIAGESASFIQLDGDLSILTKYISISGNAGLQMASNKDGIDRGGLLLKGELEYRMNKVITIKGKVKSGLERQTFIELFYLNPYLSNFTNFDWRYDIYDISGILEYHPNMDFQANAKFNMRHSDRIPVFVNTNSFLNGAFDINYESGTVIESSIEANLNLSSNDKLLANLKATSSSLSDYSSKIIPYIPELKFSIEYHRKLFDKFGTVIGIDYIGSRYADIENNMSLDEFINLKMKFDYKIIDNFLVNLYLDNILNSNIYLWNGYKERGIFISFGVRYQF